MTQLNRFPTYQELLETNGKTTRGWYSFWAGLFTGQPNGQVSAITLKSSPFSYVAPVAGSVIVNGGTVSKVEISRDGMTFYTTGLTNGMFALSQGDTVRVTYSVSPTMTLVPR